MKPPPEAKGQAPLMMRLLSRFFGASVPWFSVPYQQAPPVTKATAALARARAVRKRKARKARTERKAAASKIRRRTK